MRIVVKAYLANSENIQARNTVPQRESCKMQWCSPSVLYFRKLSWFDWGISIVYRTWDLSHSCLSFSAVELPLNCAVSHYIKSKWFASGRSPTISFGGHVLFLWCVPTLCASATHVCFCSTGVHTWCQKNLSYVVKRTEPKLAEQDLHLISVQYLE